jgi:hypothetical protein
MAYDGVLVRFLPGQLDSPGMPPGAQKRFDHAMDTLAIKGKAVWSNPVVTRSMGAKDSLVKIKDLKVGLPVQKLFDGTETRAHTSATPTLSCLVLCGI